MAPPKGKGKRSKKETSQNYTDDEDELGEKRQDCAVFRRQSVFLYFKRTIEQQKIEILRTAAVCRHYRRES